MSDDSGLKSTPSDKRRAPLENMINCPSCGFVYDTRFLAEHCRMIDGEGYRCYTCNAILVTI
jgi:uncharacterized C2H2 Zn-finger protein